MQLYLPIAEISVNVLLLLALGLCIGFLSGLFGIGGGFLMTPSLIFLGIPPVIAVSSQAPQILASSVSGGMAHWRRGNVDESMGFVLVAGGLVGSGIGVWLFSLLRKIGQIDLVISLAYAVLLGSVGLLMANESLQNFLRRNQPLTRRKLHQHNWLHRLPLKMRFRKSLLYISVLPPLAIGAVAGILVAVMGVGGGFIMIPAMIFILGMPTLMAIGTSLFQIIFVTMSVTMLHAVSNYTVDAVLSLLLTIGGVIGAQFGAEVGLRLKAEYLRGLLAILVLGIALRVTYGLFATPDDIFSIVAAPMR